MKKQTKLLAVIMSVLMFITAIPFASFADAIRFGELADEISGIVSSDSRDPAQDLFSFVYEDLFGGKTLVSYQYPVKYIDISGKIKDKSLKIKAAGRKFISEANDIISSFSEKLSDGIELSHGDFLAKLTPLFGENGVASLSDDRKNVTYTADSKTSLRYSLTYMGYKEDIIVSEYTGQTEYSFVLETNGLAVTEQYGSYFLTDGDGNVKATIGDVIIFTADERNNTLAGMTVETLEENQRYRLTIVIDPEYLSDEKTVYPITIDPTLELYYDTPATSEGRAIEDIMIAQSKVYAGTNSLNLVGKGKTAGAIRTVMNFPGLISSGVLSKNISSAHIRIRDIMCESDSMLVQCYEYTGSEWSESDPPTWASGHSAYGDLLDERYVFYGNGNVNGSPQAYSFDITAAAVKWAAGKASPKQGILFKATDSVESGSTFYKTFGSFNKTSYQPRLVVNYTDIAGLNGFYTYDAKNLSDNLTLYTGHRYGNLVGVYNFPVKAGDFPLDISLVYNSTKKDSLFFGSHELTESDYGGCGYGWKLSLSELLIPEASLSNTFSYIYIDNTGSEHILSYKSAGKYDNTDIGAELTVGSTSAVLSLKDGTKRTFSTSSYTVTSLEKDDTVYTYNYSGKKLMSVSREGKTVVSFSYAGNRLTSAGGCAVAYSGDKVASVGDRYGNTVTVSYTDGSIAFADSLTGYSYLYGFTDGRVSAIDYYRDSVQNLISHEDLTYSGNKTVISSPVSADENDPAGASTAYLFGYKGETVNVTVCSGDGSVVYSTEKTDYPENTSGARLNGSGTNLISNPFFSGNSGWNGASLSTDRALFGRYSVKLIPDTSAGYSAALLPGSYVLSAYISSSALAKKAGTDGGFSLRVLNSAGTVAGSDRVSGIKGDGWVRVFLPFTVAEAGDYTLSLSSTDTEGTVYADCVQLENGSVPTTFNAIQNSGFEDGTTGWNGGSAGGAVISGQGSIAVAPGSEAYRTVSLYSPSKRSFMLSGYAYSASGKATGVSLGITYNYSDGTSSAEVFPFTDYITGAQFASYSAVSEKFSDSLTIDSVKIALHNGSGETVCFDDILLSFGDTVSDDGGEEEDTGSYTSGLSFASQGDGTCKLSGLGSASGDLSVPPKSPAGDTVSAVAASAFLQKTGITGITLPESVTTIGRCAFQEATNLTYAEISGDVTKIDYATFYKCSNLETVNIPDTVTSVGQSAFRECFKLNQLIFPEGVTSIGAYCAYNDTALTRIYIPSTVTAIGKAAFYGPKNVTVYYNGTQAQWNAINKGDNVFSSGVSVICNCEVKDGNLYTYTTDANGNRTSTTVTSLDDKSFISSYTYDVNGNITSITDSKGNTESYTYDVSGNMTRHTDASGRTTLYTYDAHGSVLSETDAKGSVTSYTYYANGLLHTMASAGVTVTYTYDRGQVATVTQSGDGYSQNYTYTYNAYGNLISVSVGARTLVTYSYGRGGAGNVTSMTYANGYTETYTYDDRGNLLTVKENGETAYTYTYDLAGNLLTASDSKLNRRDVYLYSSDGYTAVVLTYGADGSILTVSDGNGIVRLPDGTDYTGLPENVTSDETTDDLMRTTRKALKLADSEIFSVSYSYASKASQYYTTDQVISESFSGGSAFTYGYDALGNLISVNENGIQKLNYTYDALSQLVREDNYYSGKTYIWTYDKGGNILTKSEYAYTTGTPGEPLSTVNYAYGNSDWKDLLTEYNGTAINYDLSGNPLNWRNANALTWNGRRLAGMTLTDGTELAFEYNSAGIRIGKTAGSDKTVEYLLDGTKIIREIRKVNGTVTETLLYYYNTDGDVIGLNYNGTDYYYGRNMQGDILYIYNTSGEIVTTYAYDAWGSIVSQTGTLSSTVGEANPFRYRGYYLDSETGLYYLQSRYYDAAVGRFLNADETGYIISTLNSIEHNLFAYCGNEPVYSKDTTGFFTIKIYAVAAIIAAATAAIAKIVGNFAKGLRGRQLFRGVLGASIGSAVNVVLLMKLIKWGTKGMVLAAFAAAAVQAVFDFVEGVIIDKKYRWEQLSYDLITNFASNFAGNYIAAKKIYINGNWFQPKTLSAFFTKSYGKKLISQTGIGSVVSMLIDLIRTGLSKLVIKVR